MAQHGPTIRKQFVQALPADNPYLSPEYIEVLSEAFSHRPELVEAYLHGAWDAFEGARQVITRKMIRDAQGRKFHKGETRRLVACDPARYGDDRSVIYVFENTRIIDEEVKSKISATDLAARIMAKINEWALDVEDTKGQVIEHYIPPAVLDADGLGGPVADICIAAGFTVYQIHSAGKARNEQAYHNVRAEMWWELSKKFAHGLIEWGSHDDADLEDELCQPEYDFRRGRIIMEPKEDVKKRMGGVSPDKADTYVMGQYVMPMVEMLPKRRKRQRWEEDDDDFPKGSHWSA